MSVFVVAGAALIAVGGLFGVRELVSLGPARWGEPRVRVIASRRAGFWIRASLLVVVAGLVDLAGAVTSWSAWCWSAVAVWVAILIWDVVVWLRATER